MGEFNKDQSQGQDTGQQGGKPAFGQFDKEQGQGEQGQQNQQDINQKGEELTGEKQQGDSQMSSEKGLGDDQAR